MNDPFEQWLQSEDGQRCLSWPVADVNYLRNRLWWAFNAGIRHSPFANSEQTADAPTSEVGHVAGKGGQS